MAGLRPLEIDAHGRRLAHALCRDSGLTILLTEHVMGAVMALSHHIVVLHHGQKGREGHARERRRATRRYPIGAGAARGSTTAAMLEIC